MSAGRFGKRSLLGAPAGLAVMGGTLVACGDSDEDEPAASDLQAQGEVQAQSDSDAAGGGTEPAPPIVEVDVQPTDDGKAVLVLDATNLVPGVEYSARLHSGTAEQPSASFGVLGAFVADELGEARLETSTGTQGGAGAEFDLTPELLQDGEHLVIIAGSDGSSITVPIV